MVDQLWTSPITGYRRRGTRLAELRSLFEDGITAHAILEPLKSCSADADARKIASMLKHRDFDVAGVQESLAGPVTGYVKREDLIKGVVRDYIRPITPEHLIADSTPLADIFNVFGESDYVFVVIGPEVRGIITRADLNKPPVRIYLFGLISLLEMHLTFWIRKVYPKDDWVEKITPKRLEEAKKLLQLRREKNREISLLHCLQLCDKRNIALGNQDICQELHITDPKNVQKSLQYAEDLRNYLAHSQEDITDGIGWETLIQIVTQIESLISRSDQIVENQAAEAAGVQEDGEDGLLASA